MPDALIPARAQRLARRRQRRARAQAWLRRFDDLVDDAVELLWTEVAELTEPQDRVRLGEAAELLVRFLLRLERYGPAGDLAERALARAVGLLAEEVAEEVAELAAEKLRAAGAAA